MNEGKPNLIVVSAPSGAGKSTVLGRVLAELGGIRFSVSHTTRPPREGEREGVDYHFVSREAFEALAREDALLEWARVHDHLYGTSRAELEQARRAGVDLLLDLDVQGAAQIRRRFEHAISVFILPPSFQELERRIRGRGQDGEAAIQRRLDTARAEVVLYKDYDYLLVNEDLENCVEGVKSIVRAARHRTGQAEAAALRILHTFLSR